MSAVITATLASMLIIACAGLAVPIRVAPENNANSGWLTWRLIIGVLGVLLLTLNANLWIPARPIYAVLAMLSLASVARLVRVTEVRKTLLGPIVIVGITVAGAATIAALMVRAYGWWLLEGPNHDSLLYFGGTIWAWLHALHISPDVVAQTWQLGTCNQGAVYIGNDCVGYRNGTYTLLALANGSKWLETGNTMQVLVSFAALFPAIALLPYSQQLLGGSLRKTLTAGFLIISLTWLLFFAPGFVGAFVNANMGTAFGSACFAMALALAMAPCEKPQQRAFALGLATAIAGHVYGEAMIPTGYVAASGVVIDAIRLRRPLYALTGGIVAFATFLLGLNVVVFELYDSFTAIHSLAQGGEWEGWYLDAAPWTWLAAPFSNVLLGIVPPVTKASLFSGASLGVTVVVAGLIMRTTRPYVVVMILLATLLVGYVELRNYAYGEHKILQMLGPASFMLAAYVAWNLVRVGHQARFSRSRKLLAILIVVLMSMCALLYAQRVYRFLGDLAPIHGLAPDFTNLLDKISRGENVVLDDLGAVSVEKFQKGHYLGVLLRLRGAAVLLPAIDDDALRGGYLRGIAGDSLRRAVEPHWLLRIKSEAGAKSVFEYSEDAVVVGSEYDIIDLSRVPGVVVAGNGWYGCETTHCWTREAFEIETYASAKCPTQVVVDAVFFAPPADATLTLSGDGWTENRPVSDGQITFPVPVGWARTRIKAGWRAASPRDLDMSQDARKLFAMIKGIRIECRP